MIFFFMAIGFMMLGRKVGWAFSKAIPYRSPVGATALVALSWGGAVALAMRYMIDWQHPGAILRWVMGYALGAYVAIPNFGLLAE